VYETDAKKPVLKFLALVLLVLALFMFVKGPTKASRVPAQTDEKLPTVSVAPQADTPLRILNTFIESDSTSEPAVIRLKFMAQNQSTKRIRAYAIVAEGGGGSRVDFVNLTSQEAVFQPTQVKTLEFAYNETKLPKSITLSVDFVEFDDGSTWGVDANNSRDRLVGQRQGSIAERQRLRELLKSKGPSAVLDAIREEVPDESTADAATKHSEEWLQGYRNGVGSVRYRLRQNLQSSDPASMELELARPFDSSEKQP
jgi:hypothetical protein